MRRKGPTAQTVSASDYPVCRRMPPAFKQAPGAGALLRAPHLHQEGHDGGEQLEPALVHVAHVAVQHAHLHGRWSMSAAPQAWARRAPGRVSAVLRRPGADPGIAALLSSVQTRTQTLSRQRASWAQCAAVDRIAASSAARSSGGQLQGRSTAATGQPPGRAPMLLRAGSGRAP